MTSLNNCLHCNTETEFLYDGYGVYAKCKNPNCGIRTPSLSASIEYGAKNKVAQIWNATSKEEWPEWVQPTGAHDAYSYGAKVIHKDSHWVSNIGANVWEPGVSAWAKQ